MLLSDNIARIIEKMLDDGGGSAEVRRADLADRLGCVPSQITYVISSRFTPERGYMTESRRGGGGYIRIVRVAMDKNEYLMHFFHAIGDKIDEREARAYAENLKNNGIITAREAGSIAAGLSERALEKVPADMRSLVRADIFRHILLAMIK